MTDAASARSGRARLVRVVGVVVLVVALVLALVVGVLAWRLAGQVGTVLTVPDRPADDRVQVVRAGRGTVTLRAREGGADWLDAGRVFGLDWGTGHGHVTEVRREDDDGVVVRTLRVLEGRPPQPGTEARLTREGFPRGARRVFGERVREVEVRGPTQRLPAWFVPGRSRTWAVLVHGGRASRSEMFRLMRTTVASGLPSLDITYREDLDNGGGTARLGETEWEDVEAAVQHALDRGARDVVLLGASMGGTLTAAFLERSDLADRVRAVVLDSPLLDAAGAVDAAADGWLAPAPVRWVGMRLVEARYGVDVGAADYVEDTSWLDVPALVLHGTSDGTVPAESSRRLAARAPDLVEAHFVDGAGHVESWNQGPRRYERWVRDFLAPYASDRS